MKRVVDSALWDKFLEAISLRFNKTAILLKEHAKAQLRDNVLVITLDPKDEWVKENMSHPHDGPFIAVALKNAFGEGIELVFELTNQGIME